MAMFPFAASLPPLDERMAMPVFFVPSFYLMLIFSILIRPQALRKVVITAAIVCYLWTSLHYTGGIASDYQNTTMVVASALMWIEFGVVENLERHVWQTLEQENVVPISNRTWWRKLAWSYELWSNWRGTGWNWQSRRLPMLPPHVVDKQCVNDYSPPPLLRLLFHT